MKKRILFVDDEAMVLRGIKRMLMDMRDEWHMTFVENGKSALEILAKKPADVVVSDIKMPEMDGVELMGRIKETYPDTVRIAMTGQSSATVAILSSVTVHRYISKPCKVEELKAIIVQSLERKNFVDNQSLRTILSQVHKLPSAPDIYKELTQELQKDDSSLPVVAGIISRDVSMCAKILQLVNSSFFGFARHIESPEQAVTLLGTSIIKSLVLSMHLFDEFNVDKTPGFTLKYLWEHSLRVSQLAKIVAKEAGFSPKDCDHAFVAGILHDVGKLILAAHLPDDFNRALEKIRAGGTLMWEAETTIFGNDHAAVGAYLLGMWGLPDDVVGAIAYHHQPQQCPNTTAALLALHIANIFDHRIYTFSERSLVPFVDGKYLEQMGLLDKLPGWWAIAQTFMEDCYGDA